MCEETKIEEISEWIRAQVEKSSVRGVAVGLSGGIDSSLVLALARRAVGENVVGVIMPCESGHEDQEHALDVAHVFDAETLTLPLTDVFEQMMEVLPRAENALGPANVKARLRMTALYYVANERNFLVAGTGNRTELAIGYFTKYGDGGADILPIGGLLKTEVRDMARRLGVPGAVIRKAPSAGLWEGQTDEEEIGIDYPTLDEIVDAIQSGRKPEAPQAQVDEVRRMMGRAEHKLNTPPVFSCGPDR